MEQDKLYEMLMQKDEITWQSIIYDLVNSEQMDPWDIDISLLTKRYMEAIKNLEEHNFFISGKVLLASAILLKMKSVKLVTENIAQFDSQLFQQDEDLLNEEGEFSEQIRKDYPGLLIKTPQVRKRKVTLNDLMFALQKALEVDDRRKVRKEGERILRPAELPNKKSIDITALIKQLYDKILGFFKHKEEITFTELLPSEEKMDKILTFLPLLHLSNQGKVDVNQEVSFGEIKIRRCLEENENN